MAQTDVGVGTGGSGGTSGTGSAGGDASAGSTHALGGGGGGWVSAGADGAGTTAGAGGAGSDAGIGITASAVGYAGGGGGAAHDGTGGVAGYKTGTTELLGGRGYGTGATNAGDARTNLGLGTISTQDSDAVAITGGSITGITDLAVADGGTGASSLGDGFVLLGSGTDAITALDVTAKGSILVGDGTTDPVALAVGTNDFVLTADSTQASGIKWAAAGGGGGDETHFLGPISQTDYSNAGYPLQAANFESTTTSSLSGAGDLYIWPGYIRETKTYNNLVLNVSSSATSGNIEVIIYGVGSDNLPTGKLVETGSIDVSSTGNKTVAIDTSITAGLIWYCVLVDNGISGSPALRAHFLNDGARPTHWMNAASLTSLLNCVAYEAGTYTVGNAPATPSPTSFTGAQAPPIILLTVD